MASSSSSSAPSCTTSYTGLCSAVLLSAAPGSPPSVLTNYSDWAVSDAYVPLRANGASANCLTAASYFLCGIHVPVCSSGNNNNNNNNGVLYSCKSTCTNYLIQCGPYLTDANWPISCDETLSGLPAPLSDVECLYPPALVLTATEVLPVSIEQSTAAASAASTTTSSASTATQSSPTSKPSSSSTSVPQAVQTSCPPPLVYLEDPPASCNGTCCPICPPVNVMTRPGLMRSLWLYNHIPIVVISSLCALIVIVTHLVLPNRRNQRGAFVISLNAAILIECLSIVIGIPNPSLTLCKSTYESADIHYSWCRAQGFIFVLGFHGIALSTSLIIFNLHMILVWKKRFIECNYMLALVIVWAVAVLFSLLPIGYLKIEPLPDFICSVRPANLALYIFLPQALFIFSLLPIQISTLVYSMRTRKLPTTDADRHLVRSEIRFQWRAVFLSLLFQVSWWAVFAVFLQFSQFSDRSALKDLAIWPGYANINTSPRLDYIKDWLACLDANAPNGQELCAGIISDNSPKLPINIFLLDTHLLCGLYSFIIFVATNTAVLQEWRDCLFPKYAAKRTIPIVLTHADLTVSPDTSRPPGFLRSIGKIVDEGRNSGSWTSRGDAADPWSRRGRSGEILGALDEVEMEESPAESSLGRRKSSGRRGTSMQSSQGRVPSTAGEQSLST
ncbi:hypothetical protein DFJ73DRAFT_548374 [Zopfochytrium polystomum]|nr:hypothetical protein DFJ73DRAFT_548374 [Zopfochytrium polystomum]